MPEIDTGLASVVTGQTPPSVRPPDFLLPKASGKLAEGRHGKIYLSWGGEIYGPASQEEILSGIRASWFESGALYWHEGLTEWKPLAEFAASPSPSRADWQRVPPRDLPSAPSLPVSTGANPDRPKKRRPRGSKPRRAGIGRPSRALVFGFVFVAVLLTVLILVLLMQV